MEDGHPVPTVLVGSELKKKLNFHLDENDTRGKTRRRGIFQLDPGNYFFGITSTHRKYVTREPVKVCRKKSVTFVTLFFLL